MANYIAVQDGKKMVREKQGSLREDARQAVIEKQGGWDGHFHYIASDVPGLTPGRSEPSCPAIPLSSSWLRVDDSKRANKLEITFPAHLGMFLSGMNVFLDNFKADRLPRTFEIQARSSTSE
jgi:hypothetical protein